MKFAISILLTFVLSIGNFISHAQRNSPFKAKQLFRSDKLVITQISANAFEHTSFLQTNAFGYVPCKGLIVRNAGETIVFDTPTNDSSSNELISWIKTSLQCKLNAVVPTHFHNDGLGGLKAFHENGILSYACFKTIELAGINNYTVPKNSFTDSLVLKVGKERATAKFFGEGHTRDNVVGYFPVEHIMFGGCLIKETGAGKGYPGDANVAEWSATVAKVKTAYPHVKLVVPGHGDYGNKSCWIIRSDYLKQNLKLDSY